MGLKCPRTRKVSAVDTFKQAVKGVLQDAVCHRAYNRDWVWNRLLAVRRLTSVVDVLHGLVCCYRRFVKKKPGLLIHPAVI